MRWGTLSRNWVRIRSRASSPATGVPQSWNASSRTDPNSARASGSTANWPVTKAARSSERKSEQGTNLSPKMLRRAPSWVRIAPSIRICASSFARSSELVCSELVCFFLSKFFTARLEIRRSHEAVIAVLAFPHSAARSAAFCRPDMFLTNPTVPRDPDPSEKKFIRAHVEDMPAGLTRHSAPSSPSSNRAARSSARAREYRFRTAVSLR